MSPENAFGVIMVVFGIMCVLLAMMINTADKIKEEMKE